MIISVNRWLHWLKFMLMFFILTILLYYLTGFISEWVHPTRRYHEPEGQSIKAFYHSGAISEIDSIMNRLRFFYWMGE